MIYIPVKDKSDRRSSYTEYHPAKASGDQKMGNLLTALYLRHFFNYCFDKKGFDSLDIQKTFRAKIQLRSPYLNIRYRAFKSLRSYSAAEEKEGVKGWLVYLGSLINNRA
jgi:hypothetical protein